MISIETRDSLQGREFGEGIRAKRMALGLSQMQVGTAMGLSVSRYNALELGQLRRLPTPSQLEGLAGVLAVSPEWLLTAAGYSLSGEKV